jgi:hypothetical protein
MLHGCLSFKFEQKKSAGQARRARNAIQRLEFLLKIQQKNADATDYKKCYTGVFADGGPGTRAERNKRK